MSIRHAMLGLLADGPLHGYGLKGAYEKDLLPGSQLNIGQVYQTLDKLEPEGFVTVEVVPQPERPDRKVYTLTARGRKELVRWLDTPSERGLELRNETFLKLMVAWRIQRKGPGGPLEAVLTIIAAERSVCLGHLHELTDARRRVEKDNAGLGTTMLLDLAIHRLTAFQHWLERCEELFRARATRA